MFSVPPKLLLSPFSRCLDTGSLDPLLLCSNTFLSSSFRSFLLSSFIPPRLEQPWPPAAGTQSRHSTPAHIKATLLAHVCACACLPGAVVTVGPHRVWAVAFCDILEPVMPLSSPIHSNVELKWSCSTQICLKVPYCSGITRHRTSHEVTAVSMIPIQAISQKYRHNLDCAVGIAVVTRQRHSISLKWQSRKALLALCMQMLA